MVRTGISLAFERSFALPRPQERDAGDWFYLVQPAGGGLPTAIYAPLGAFLRAGSILASGLLPPGMLRGRVTDISICLWSALFTAALVWPLSRLFRYGGGGRTAAAPVAAALVLGTALGPLGTSDFQEPFLAFLLAASLERVLRARRLGESLRPRHLLLGGGLAGAALLAKPTATKADRGFGFPRRVSGAGAYQTAPAQPGRRGLIYLSKKIFRTSFGELAGGQGFEPR